MEQVCLKGYSFKALLLHSILKKNPSWRRGLGLGLLEAGSRKVSRTANGCKSIEPEGARRKEEGKGAVRRIEK